MRTLRPFEAAVHIVTKSGAFASEAAALSPNQQLHASASAAAGWKSPVPYLFGGLAAMLGLIAFALLILACSYWKLSGNFDSGDEAVDSDEKLKVADAKAAVYANSILVIMAGEENPTFLAMPAASRTTSFGDTLGGPSFTCSCSNSSGEKENDTKVMTSTTVISQNGEENR